MSHKPDTKTGMARIWAALVYSLSGLGHAFRQETAFRQELGIWLVLLVVLCFVPLSMVFKSLLLFVNTLVLIVELLNSAIESTVDMASPEYHPLAKRAKDMGSAAVFSSLMLAAVMWIFALFTIFSGSP